MRKDRKSLADTYAKWVTLLKIIMKGWFLMVKARKKPASAKGAVLLMVLTVMFVLIFMLAGTMAVVYSAHNRALAKYEESQGYYSARSVLDIYCDDLLNDATTETSNYAYYYDDSGNIKTTTGKITYGRALEYELYKLNVDTSSTNKYYRADYDNYSVLSESAFKAMVNGDSTAFASDSVGNQYRPETSYGDTYTYTIQASDLEGYGTGYGKVIDQGSNVTITVQLLSRVYDIGTNVVSSTDTATDISGYVASGSRAKDQFTVKVTASVVYDNNTYETAYIFSSNYVPPVSGSGAIDSLGGISSSGAGLKSNGGFSSLYRGSTTVDAAGITGSMFLAGDAVFNSSGTYTISAGDGAVILGDVTFVNPMNFVSNGSGSYVYVGGTLNLMSNIGDLTNPIDVMCDVFTYPNSYTIYGNLYCNEFDWMQSSGSGFTINGTVYTENVVIPSSHVSFTNNDDGTVSYAANQLGTNTVHYCDDILVSYWDNAASATVVDTIDNYVTYCIGDTTNTYLASTSAYVIKDTSYTSVALDYFDETTYEESSDSNKVTLPAANSVGNNYYNIKTFHSAFEGKFDETCFEDGDFVGFTISSAYADDAAFTTYVDANKLTVDSTIAQIDGSFDATNHKISTSTALTDVAVYDASSSRYVVSDGKYGLYNVSDLNRDSYVYRLDITNGDIIIQLEDGSGTYNYNFEVYWTGCDDGTVDVPSHYVYFLFPGDDTNTVTYNLGTNSSNNFKIVYPKVNDGSTLYLGTSSTPTKSPHVYYLAAGPSKINITGPNSHMAGYWNVPESDIYVDTNTQGLSANGYYDGVAFSGEKSWAFGAVVCGSYSCPQSIYVQFIDPNQNDMDANLPNFSWQGIAYTASGD